MATKKRRAVERPKAVKVDIWDCKDLKAAVKERIMACVKDASQAKALENALADIVAYAAGPVGITKK